MLDNIFKDFLSIVEKEENLIILTHKLVDIDAMTSCFSLKSFLQQYCDIKKIDIYFSEITKSTLNYIRRLNNKFPQQDFNYLESIQQKDLEKTMIIILDSHDLSIVEPFDKIEPIHLKKPLIFVDHHYLDKNQVNSSTDNNFQFILDNYTSTAEIIYDLYKYSLLEIPDHVAYLLLGGLLTDSGLFRYGNNETLFRASELLKSTKGINIQELFLLLRTEIDLSERIANIKGAQRAILIKQDNILIATSRVSSYGGSVASNLLKLGYDIAIIGTEDINENRISARARKELCIEKQLHLGKLFEEIKEILGCNGGGHDGAAGLNGSFEIDAAMEVIIQKIKEILKN